VPQERIAASIFEGGLMAVERRTVHDQTMPHGDRQIGWASRIRSISFVEMGRSAAIILNEALIFACQIFGR
jgi:hypothetical protein